LIDNIPVKVPQFRLGQETSKALQEKIDKLAEAGVIRPSSSPYNAPTFVIRQHSPEGQKKNGGWLQIIGH
jgi:hypothetical protein